MPEVWFCPYYQGYPLLTGLRCGSVYVLSRLYLCWQAWGLVLCTYYQGYHWLTGLRCGSVYVLSRLYLCWQAWGVVLCTYYQGYPLLTGMRCGSVYVLSRLYLCWQAWDAVLCTYYQGCTCVNMPEVWFCPYYQGYPLLTGLRCGSVYVLSRLSLVDRPGVWFCVRIIKVIPGWQAWGVVLCTYYQGCTWLTGLRCGSVYVLSRLYLCWQAWGLVLCTYYQGYPWLTGLGCGSVYVLSRLYLCWQAWGLVLCTYYQGYPWLTGLGCGSVYVLSRLYLCWQAWGLVLHPRAQRCSLLTALKSGIRIIKVVPVLTGLRCGSVYVLLRLSLVDRPVVRFCVRIIKAVLCWQAWGVVLHLCAQGCSLLTGLRCGSPSVCSRLFLVDRPEVWFCVRIIKAVPCWQAWGVVLHPCAQGCPLLTGLRCGSPSVCSRLFLVDRPDVWFCVPIIKAVPCWQAWGLVLHPCAQGCPLLTGLRSGSPSVCSGLSLVDRPEVWFFISVLKAVPCWQAWGLVLHPCAQGCPLLTGLRCGSPSVCSRMSLVDRPEVWFSICVLKAVPCWHAWGLVLHLCAQSCPLLTGLRCGSPSVCSRMSLVDRPEVWFSIRVLKAVPCWQAWGVVLHPCAQGCPLLTGLRCGSPSVCSRLSVIDMPEVWFSIRILKDVPCWQAWGLVLHPCAQGCPLLTGLRSGSPSVCSMLSLVDRPEVWFSIRVLKAVPCWQAWGLVLHLCAQGCPLLTGLRCGSPSVCSRMSLVDRPEVCFSIRVLKAALLTGLRSGPPSVCSRLSLVDRPEVWFSIRVLKAVPCWQAWGLVLHPCAQGCPLLTGLRSGSPSACSTLFLVDSPEVWYTYYQGCTCVDRPEVRFCVRIIKVIPGWQACGAVLCTYYQGCPLLTGLRCGSPSVCSRLFLVDRPEVWFSIRVLKAVPCWQAWGLVLCTYYQGCPLLTGLRCGSPSVCSRLSLVDRPEVWFSIRVLKAVPCWQAWCLVLCTYYQGCPLLTGLRSGSPSVCSRLSLVDRPEVWFSIRVLRAVPCWQAWGLVLYLCAQGCPLLTGLRSGSPSVCSRLSLVDRPEVWFSIRVLKDVPCWQAWGMVLHLCAQGCPLLTCLRSGSPSVCSKLSLVDRPEVWFSIRVLKDVPCWQAWGVVLHPCAQGCPLLTGLRCGSPSVCSRLSLVDRPEVWFSIRVLKAVRYWHAWGVVLHPYTQGCPLLTGLRSGSPSVCSRLSLVDRPEVWFSICVLNAVPCWQAWGVVLHPCAQGCPLLTGLRSGSPSVCSRLSLVDRPEVWFSIRVLKDVPCWQAWGLLLHPCAQGCPLLTGLRSGPPSVCSRLSLVDRPEVWFSIRVLKAVPCWQAWGLVLHPCAQGCPLLTGMRCGSPSVCSRLSLVDRPEVWFSIRVLKAVQMMEIPLLKSWIHSVVMDGLTQALVDPGKIDIRTNSTGPTKAPAKSKVKARGIY